MAPTYVNGAANESLYTAAKTDQQKVYKYGPLVPDDSRFYGGSIEAMCGWGDSISSLFNAVRDYVEKKGKLEGDEFAHNHFTNYWLPVISTCIMRSNALAVLHRSRTVGTE